MKELASHDFWQVFGGQSENGTPVCSLTTTFNDGRTVMLRRFQHQDFFELDFLKPSWSIPNGTPITVVISFGSYSPWTGHGHGESDIISFPIAISQIKEVLSEMMQAAAFTVSFPAGNEPTWSGGLGGVTSDLEAYSDCIGSLFPPSTTQPFPQPPSQPYQQQNAAPQLPPQPTPAPSPPAGGDGLDHV